jgi:flagellum-specific peptidoglycan hydrolase FlgJ
VPQRYFLFSWKEKCSMSTKTDKFIETVGVLARNEYLSRKKWILPSVCIAQAALESGWNLEAKTLFGIKGKGFVATTSEYYRTLCSDSGLFQVLSKRGGCGGGIL